MGEEAIPWRLHSSKKRSRGASQVEDAIPWSPNRRDGTPRLAAASFQPKGEEELELTLAPATNSGFLGIQDVAGGCFQGKIKRKGGDGFVSLPASGSVLIAAWWFAKAVKARDNGTLDSSHFKASMTEVR